MKTLFTKTLAVAVAVLFSVSAIAQSDSLKITYDASLSGATCQPIGATEMFIHSGVGQEAYWSYVVGAWNAGDTTASGDTLGKMMSAGTDMWTITLHLRDYYSQASNGPIPQDTTITKMGMVFRNGDGSLEGKDDNCVDIFVEGLNTATPTVTNKDGSPFDGVTVEWVGSTGIEDINSSVASINAYPNPVTSSTTINYTISDNIDNLEITVMDALGRNIATLYNGTQEAGDHQVRWDASNVNSGVYFYTFSNGESMVTKKLMVVK